MNAQHGVGVVRSVILNGYPVSKRRRRRVPWNHPARPVVRLS